MIGKYRNKQGVELEVVALRIDRNIIGSLWDADIKDDLFGVRHYIVTPEGLKDCGYEKIDDEAPAHPTRTGTL